MVESSHFDCYLGNSGGNYLPLKLTIWGQFKVNVYYYIIT
jgi:hypothetical protein